MIGVVPADGLGAECVEFLYREAELLDAGDLRGWLALLTPDIDYRVPVRVTRERDAGVSPFSDRAFHMIEDHGSLRARIDRLETEYAWAEDPPSRTRRFVTNVRVAPAERPEEIDVRSNVLLFRARGEATPYLISCERRDRLRRVVEGLRLARRLVLLDHTWLPAENLAVFL